MVCIDVVVGGFFVLSVGCLLCGVMLVYGGFIYFGVCCFVFRYFFGVVFSVCWNMLMNVFMLLYLRLSVIVVIGMLLVMCFSVCSSLVC